MVYNKIMCNFAAQKPNQKIEFLLVRFNDNNHNIL